MKLTTSVLILALTGCALAQAPASKPGTAARPAATGTKSAQPAQKPATTSAKPQTPPAKTTTAAKPATSPKPATAMKPATAQPKNAAPAMAKAKAAKPAKAVVSKQPAPAAAPTGEKKPAESVANVKNRRDPFVSVVMSREGPPCSGGGKKCIAIDQVTLQGVVRSPGGAIAVVSSGANKTYFLRENDPVYNGVVVKIAPDSIVFRETVMDRLGKTSQREVVKKIRNSPSV